MNQDAADFFNAQADAALARHQAAAAKSVANGSYARKQWMTAASEALRSGARFSCRNTRQIAKPWDGRMSALAA